jgi:hypothetical protein
MPTDAHHLARGGTHRFSSARIRYPLCPSNRVIQPVDTESPFGKD